MVLYLSIWIIGLPLPTMQIHAFLWIHVELDFGFVAETKLFNTYIMPVVQKLYDACRVSFSTHGPISEEALGKVCAILGVLLESFEFFIIT